MPGFFDPTITLLKALVNCTRFSELHVRILEDSCLPTFFSALQALPNKTAETAHQICRFVRSLSETEKRRMELITRGPVKLLAEFEEFSDDSGKKQLLQALSNIVDCTLVFPPKTDVTHLSLLVHLCTQAMRSSDDITVKQRGLYCLSVITKPRVDANTKYWPWCSLEATAEIIDLMDWFLLIILLSILNLRLNLSF